MPPRQTPIERYSLLLVGQYLHQLGLNDTFHEFIKETGISTQAINEKTDKETLDIILKDRYKFNEHQIAENLLDTDDDHNKVDLKLKNGWNFIVKPTADESIENIKELVIDCSYNPDKKFLILATALKILLVYDCSTKKITEHIKCNNIVRLCGWLPRLSAIYTCNVAGELTLYSCLNYEVIGTWKLHTKFITQISFYVEHDLLYIASSGMDLTLKLHILHWNAQKLQLMSEVKLRGSCSTLQLAISKDENLLAFITIVEYTNIICYQIDEKNKYNEFYELALNDSEFTRHSFSVRNTIWLNAKKDVDTGNLALQEDTLLCVTTSHIPYMRFIIVSLPTIVQEGGVLYNKIKLNISTIIPQDNLTQLVVKNLSENENGVIIGGDNGLYAIDLMNYNSWAIQPSFQKRVKSMDVGNNHLMVAFQDKTLQMFSYKDDC